jgi:hypothetical protein
MGIFGRIFGEAARPSPEDAKLTEAIIHRMVDQVRAGEKPWKVTPPPGVSAERSRELLKDTDIHSILKREWDKKQQGDASAGKIPYDGRNPALPAPHWWN